MSDRPTVALRVRRGGSYRDLPDAIRELYEHMGGDPQAAWERADGVTLGARSRVRALVESSGAEPGRPVTLDAEGLEVLTGPAAHELLLTWPGSEVVNAGEFVRESFAIAREQIARRT